MFCLRFDMGQFSANYSPQFLKFIHSLDWKYSNCILTPNEDFLYRGRFDLFDAVVIAIEAFKEDTLS